MGLTKRRIDKMTEPGRYGDGHGLYLQVHGPTNRSWIFRYEVQGRERWMGLGALHAFNLEEARERARKARQQLSDGADPIEARLAERDAQRKEAAERVEFRDAAEKYLALHESHWGNSKHRKQWRTTLRDYAYPALGARPVKTIDTALINQALAPIWQKIPETAKRVKTRIECVLRWVAEGQPLPAPKASHKNHHPALPYAEIPAFMTNLRQREGVAARALEFLILTAARSGEVRGASWGEIDLARQIWVVPANRMKAGTEHSVPLSDRAVEILGGLTREEGNDRLFIGTRKGSGLFSGALLEVLQSLRTGYVAHGFRSSFRDWAAERGYDREIAEEALAHKVGNQVERAYRRTDLLEQRRRMMSDWARYCNSVPTVGAEVISIRR